jgi:hypothetical protein
MVALVWDDAGNRFYETGISKGVFYPIDGTGAYPLGYAWNGLISVSENPSGAEPTALYADNIKYLTLMSAEEFGLTLEAYTYPDEFALCDGSAEPQPGVLLNQQPRKIFGLCYQTKVGNDVDGEDHGYKIHLVYGCLASPSEKAYQTVNDSPEAITFSWEVSTTPPAVTGYLATASIIIDSRTADPTDLAAFELLLYGDVATDPELPLPDEVITAFTP